MTRNTGWGSSSSAPLRSRSSGWSQDSLPKDAVPAPVPSPAGISKTPVTEEGFVEKNRDALLEIFGENFQGDPRYALALAEVLEGKRSIHMILAGYRPREIKKPGGAGW